MKAAVLWRQENWIEVQRSAHRLKTSLRGQARRWIETASGYVFDTLFGVYRTDGLSFLAPTDVTDRRYRGRFLINQYELSERTLLRRHLSADATVLELGGGLGVVSCMTNKRLKDATRHVVIEAHPQAVHALAANRRRNAMAFHIEHCIVCENGMGEFGLTPVFAGCSQHRKTHRRVRVPTRRLAEIEAETGLAFDSFVIDIEGGEHQFVTTYRDRFAKAKLAIVEFHPQFIGERACEEVREVFRASGLERVGKRGRTEAWARRERSSLHTESRH